MPTLTLPGPQRSLQRYTTQPPATWPSGRPPYNRAALAAAHVVADPLADADPWGSPAIDWDATIDYRHYLWSLGLGVRMYNGDELNFPDLIAGDDDGYSHALLGGFDPIAPAAAAALACLQRDDLDAYHAVLRPTLPLARHLFRAPTPLYKTGVVFMAYLNGHQSHFTMVGGQQSARALPHLAELFRLADAAGLLRDPDDACARMARVLAVGGIV